MKLTKKYYIVLIDGEYHTHGESSAGQHLSTIHEIVPFDDKEKFIGELSKYNIEYLELEEVI